MKRNRDRYNNQNIRTFGFITGAVLLLAVLTVVLCAMAGVFNFSAKEGGDELVTAPPAASASTPAQAQTPAPTPTGAPTPTPTAETVRWIISAIAGKGGDLSPSGQIQVEEGGSVTFTITPEEGYALSELKVDGATVSSADAYTFEDVKEAHSIYAVFTLIPQETVPAATETPSSPTDIG